MLDDYYESRPRQLYVLGSPKQYKNQPKCWFFIAFCFIASNIVLSNL